MPRGFPLVSPSPRCWRCSRWFARFVWFNRVGAAGFFANGGWWNTFTPAASNWNFPGCACSLVRGLIAENVRLGHAAAPDSPALPPGEVRLGLDDMARCCAGGCKLTASFLRQGQFILPLSPTNALTLDHIQTELRFQANDTWSLDNFQAGFAGVKLPCPPTSPTRRKSATGQFFAAPKPAARPRRGRNCKNFPTPSAGSISPARRN